MNEQLQLGVAGEGKSPYWERCRELDAKIVKALRSNLLQESDKEILRVIAGHKGAENAIRSEDVAAAAGRRWCERTRREIAGVVETAVLFFRIPIGGLRMKPYGYFVIVTAKDLELAVQPLSGEFHAMLRRIRALTSKQDAARMFGQAMLKLDSQEVASEELRAARKGPECRA